MGGKSSTFDVQGQNFEQLAGETGFTVGQIGVLWNRFASMDTDSDGYLTRKEFLCIPELTINPLCDRIIHAFFCDGEASQDPNLAKSEEQAEEADKSNQDVITFPDFVKVLAKFKPIDKVEENNKLNSREERLKFAFRMYDLDGNGFIAKEELFAVLKMIVGAHAHLSEEQLMSIAEQTLKEADENKDNLISFEDFCQVLKRLDIEQKMSMRFLG